MTAKIPLHLPNMRIGLMGGSFDPAHAGHLHCARTAMRRLGLHQVWWLVSPQNPLKPRSAALADRAASVQSLAPDRRQRVTTFESTYGLCYTVDTLAFLKPRANEAKFFWVMGEDNMASFHRWRRWRDIFHTVPIVIIPRPSAGAHVQTAKAFAAFRAARVQPSAIITAQAPAWSLLSGPRSPLSSTAIRAARNENRVVAQA